MDSFSSNSEFLKNFTFTKVAIKLRIYFKTSIIFAGLSFVPNPSW